MNDKTPPADVRPIVAPPRSARSVWLFAALLLAGAVVLFIALEARRAAHDVQSTFPSGTTADAGMISSLPPLQIPADTASAPASSIPDTLAIPAAGVTLITPGAIVERPRQSRQPAYTASAWSPPPMALPPISPAYGASGPSGGSPFAAPSAPLAGTAAAGDKNRAMASFLANPAMTVPQGAVIPAVLETAVDSTRGGFARAIVSRDVRGFDGSRILIPRGSRLLGDYKSDLSQGQNRVSIQWKRLIRPDGAVIDIDSPAADPLGRAGVKGKVNSHFFERFGGNILQSTLDIGVGLATRSVTNGTVVLALPGGAGGQGVVPQVQPEQVRPTVTIRQGTSVSVFVAHDLDFSPVEK